MYSSAGRAAVAVTSDLKFICSDLTITITSSFSCAHWSLYNYYLVREVIVF